MKVRVEMGHHFSDFWDVVPLPPCFESEAEVRQGDREAGSQEGPALAPPANVAALAVPPGPAAGSGVLHARRARAGEAQPAAHPRRPAAASAPSADPRPPPTAEPGAWPSRSARIYQAAPVVPRAAPPPFHRRETRSGCPAPADVGGLCAARLSSADHGVAVAEAIMPSKGSSVHGFGVCTPCKFFRSRLGCRDGEACGFCHYPHQELTKSGLKRLLQRRALSRRAECMRSGTSIRCTTPCAPCLRHEEPLARQASVQLPTPLESQTFLLRPAGRVVGWSL